MRDYALVTAMVERWYQETQTFHLPVSEVTVTLQNVAVLLGYKFTTDLSLAGHLMIGEPLVASYKG